MQIHKLEKIEPSEFDSCFICRENPYGHRIDILYSKIRLIICICEECLLDRNKIWHWIQRELIPEKK